MFRPPTSISALKFVVGISLCGLGGAMLYVYFRHRDDEEDVTEGISRSTAAKRAIENEKKEVTIQIIISNDHIPLVVGRSGANLKIIEDKTGTAIRFREKDSNNQLCEVRGTPDGVRDAKAMLMKEVQRSPIVKEEIYVPQSVCGKIIGRCGESLHEICRVSLAKVSIDSGTRSGTATRRIDITGNRNQVDIAKRLIEAKIKEDEEYRRTIDEVEAKREPRRSPTNSVCSMTSSQTSLTSSHLPPREKFNPNESEKPMEVYVSAIATPAKFWLQLIGPQSKKLDELVATMTEYYNDVQNQQLHRIVDPYLGQIVAALYKYDGKWYRAEIVGILPNEYNPRDVVLDLYFVDYGDSEYVAPHEVFELRTDFLTLRFQAIECYLAYVKPTLSNDDPEIWDKQTIEKFEELTQVANWKKLISRVVTYKERPKGGNHIRREGSPVPGVELYDPTEGVNVNIGHMLISHGLAVSDYPADSDYAAEAIDVLSLDGGHEGTLNGGSSNNNTYPNDRSITNANEQSNSPFNSQASNGDHLKLNSTVDHTSKFIESEKHFNGNHKVEEKSQSSFMSSSSPKDQWRNVIS